MDHKFTEQIKQWLEKPHVERDYSVGALYLLKLSGNQIMYRNLIANPSAKADFIEYQIQKYYNFRVQALTHEQVEDMAAQADGDPILPIALETVDRRGIHLVRFRLARSQKLCDLLGGDILLGYNKLHAKTSLA